MDLNGEKHRFCLSLREQKYAANRLCTPGFYITMKSAIDPSCLKEAVVYALKLHPVFATRLIRDQGLYWLEENDSEPVIRQEIWDKPLVFGTEEYHGFPWVMTWSGAVIRFVCSHAPSDGTGIVNFLRDVLVRYLQVTGKMRTDPLPATPDGEPDDRYDSNPYLFSSDEPVYALGMPHFPPASPLPGGTRMFEKDIGKINVYDLILKQDEIRALAGESETSTFSVIACLLARAMQKTFAMDDGHIEVRVPVDLRPHFGTKTDRNFVYGFSLHYDAGRMKNMASPRVETAFRSQLDLYLDRDNLMRKMQNEKVIYLELQKHPESADSLPAADSGGEGSMARIRYTHINRINFPDEVEQNIEKMQLAFTSRLTGDFFVTAINQGNEIHLAVLQNTRNDAYIQVLTDEIRQRGLDCHTELLSPYPEAEYRPEGIFPDKCSQ